MQIDVSIVLTILGMAFGGWAFVVAWGVGVIRKEVKELKEQILLTSQTQILHVNQTERRLTMLETEFSFLRRRLDHSRQDSKE